MSNYNRLKKRKIELLTRKPPRTSWWWQEDQGPFSGRHRGKKTRTAGRNRCAGLKLTPTAGDYTVKIIHNTLDSNGKSQPKHHFRPENTGLSASSESKSSTEDRIEQRSSHHIQKRIGVSGPIDTQDKEKETMKESKSNLPLPGFDIIHEKQYGLEDKKSNTQLEQHPEENYSTKAIELIDKGYSPVAIAPGKKSPVHKNWTTLNCVEFLKEWPPEHGVGLRCGDNNLIGIDIDIYDSRMVNKILDVVKSCVGDNTIKRVGQAPKVLIPLICSEITKKMVSNRYLDPSTGNVNAIEILSGGQQFIVYGIHPDTQLPYRLSRALPAINELPSITLSLLELIFNQFDKFASDARWKLIVPPKSDKTVENRKQTPEEREYNNNRDITELLLSYGWKPCKNDHWTRPGKNSGVSGTLTKNTFYPFTSSTVLEPNMTHRPYDIVLAYDFNGDTEAMAAHVKQFNAERIAKIFRDSPSVLPPGASAIPLSTDNDEQWPPPIPVDTPVLPTITRGMMPGILEDMVFAISEHTETPPELATALCLAVCATACQKKWAVESTPGHTEQLSLWAVAALESGNRKSAVEKIAVDPLRKWEMNRRKSLEPEIKEATAKRESELNIIKGLRKKLSNCPPEKREAIKSEIAALERDLTEVPKPPQIWDQDITPEHLGTVMNDNNESMGLFSSEGGIFDIIGGRYSGGVPNLDIFLQSHSGDPVRVSRGSRPPVNLSEPALSIGLSPQPSVLKSMADSPGFRGRGLVARFMFFLPASPLGDRKIIDRPKISLLTREGYSTAIQKLLNIPYPESEPSVIKLSPGAADLWINFSVEVEEDLGDGGKFEYIKDWAGKLPGLVARIAGVYHCVESDGDTISEKTMAMVLKLAKVFIPHALATFDLMGADEGLVGARKIFAWINRKSLSEFSRRDCFEANKGTFKSVQVMQTSLKVLEERYYIKQRDPEKKPGRPSVMYDVTPLLKN